MYEWIKVLHVISFVAWFAGLFYLPRLYVYHAENADHDHTRKTLETMEYKLLKFIMNPAMIVAWFCGLMMVFTPGIVDWSEFWPWTKGVSIIMMTWFHHWLGLRRKDFVNGNNTLTGRSYRMMNEVPTILMVIIVISVIVKF